MNIVYSKAYIDRHYPARPAQGFDADLVRYIKHILKIKGLNDIFSTDDLNEDEFWYLNAGYQYQRGAFVKRLNKLIDSHSVGLKRVGRVNRYKYLYKRISD